MIKFTASEDRVIRSVTATVTEKVTEKEQQLLNLILEDPAYTSQEMADKLSISRKTVSLRLKKLKEKRVIERIGSDTKGHWKIHSQ